MNEQTIDASQKLQQKLSALNDRHSKPKKRLIFDPSITEHRAKLFTADPPFKALEVPYVDMLVPVEDNVKIPVRIYTPRGLNEKIPTVFYIPGTGFVATEIKFTHVTCTHVCQTARCRVVVINHRLAPENQFPIPYLDAYNVFKFFVKEAPRAYGIDTSKIAIVGYSSGGNIAALMTIRAMQESLPVRKQILISAMVDFSRSLPYFKDYEEQDNDITAEFVHWVINLYLPPNISTKNPSVSPFWAKDNEIRKLPSTDIILAEYDRCRGDSEYYYLKLKSENVPVEKFMIPNETHAHMWRNMEVTYKLAERIKIAFSSYLESPLSNTISRVTIAQSDEEQEDQSKLTKARL